MINRIPTSRNCTSKGNLASLKHEKPHSKADNFSESGADFDKEVLARNNATPRKTAAIKAVNSSGCSDIWSLREQS